MNCKEYIFSLTSGQLAEARWPLRVSAYMHRSVCKNCQRFTVNDGFLTEIIKARATQTPKTEGSDQMD